MRPEEIRKLAGGYASGTLTRDELHALLEAALLDQNLFNELAQDQALKDLIEDPQVRRQLLDALQQQPSRVDILKGWFTRPAFWALASGMAATAVLLVVWARRPAVQPPMPEPVLMAKRQAPPELPPAEAEAPRVLDDTAPKRERQAVAPEKTQPFRSGDREPGAARLEFLSAAADAFPSPIPYRLLRATVSGEYVEALPSAVFGNEDRIRLVFEPAESGRLRVVSGSSKTILDQEVEAGGSVSVDVPARETRITGAFREAPYEIRLRRGP